MNDKDPITREDILIAALMVLCLILSCGIAELLAQ